MASPPKVPNALHVTIDPQLVHDLAQTFHAGVGKKRAKILWFVQASRFHAFENESGVFAQPTHGGCSIITAAPGTNVPRPGEPSPSVWTAVGSFWLAYFCRLRGAQNESHRPRDARRAASGRSTTTVFERGGYNGDSGRRHGLTLCP